MKSLRDGSLDNERLCMSLVQGVLWHRLEAKKTNDENIEKFEKEIML